MAMREPHQAYQQWNTAPQTAPERRQQPRPATKTVKIQRNVGLSMMELFVYAALVVTIAILLLFVLSLKSDSFTMQAEKTELENAIYMTQGEITELETEVNHLASHERIYDKANELGLTMNNSHIRVVEKNE